MCEYCRGLRYVNKWYDGNYFCSAVHIKSHHNSSSQALDLSFLIFEECVSDTQDFKPPEMFWTLFVMSHHSLSVTF